MGIARGLTIAAAVLALPGVAAAQRQPPRAVTEDERREAREALAAFTRPTLARFDSEAEFRRYVEAVREVDRTSGRYYYSALAGQQYAQASAPAQAQSDAQPETCVPTPTNPCTEDEALSVTVTGTRINPRNPSITNNQLRGVEEGDIVKQIDHYLLVLQDGRIFVIDMQGRGGMRSGRRLALTDRADVYRNPRSGIWYDEMLVFGDRVLITGYSYEEGATELAVFRLGEGGRLAREGVFRISSNDYYSDNNYATRLIDGNLVTYTPLRVSDMARAGYRWPVVRRWLAEDDAREIAEGRPDRRERRERGDVAGPPLLDAAQIYRPVVNIDDPMVHTVSVCPLSSVAGARPLQCRTTAFAGPPRPEWLVTGTDVFLWTAREYPYDGSEECRPGAPADFAPAYIYRVPVSGARPDLIAARGFPPDQFAIQSDGTNLQALVRMEPANCREAYDAPPRLNFFTVPLARLGPTLAAAPASSFTVLPSTASRWVVSRFTDRYLVYGGLSQYRGGFPDLDDYADDYRRRVLDLLRPRPAYVVPIARPSAVRPIDIGHTVIRAERVADDIVLTGYRDRGGLIVTLIDLDGRPGIASSVRLAGRYESEGRSHAFNSLIERDGSGLMGLPTVPRIADGSRDYWRSRASDLSFLSVDSEGRLEAIGALERRFDYVDDYDPARGGADEDGVPGYECEVSCIDWYGNSRPIFTDGRIFALSGTELIEGRVERGRIREVQRLNIALSRPPSR
jgi:beta propeller domain-containing protein